MSIVLVTGADGFIGSHLVQSLVLSGFKRAFCIYVLWGWLLDSLDHSLKSQFEVVLGGRDPVCVRQAMMGCDTVYHLAALIAIPYSYVAPASYINTNVHGTLKTVQAARDLGISRVVHTSFENGSAQFVPITEDHPQVGQFRMQLARSLLIRLHSVIGGLGHLYCFTPQHLWSTSEVASYTTIISQLAAGQRD